MLQARRLGKQLFVGIHSDEEIIEHKGPTVMTLEERSVDLVWVDDDQIMLIYIKGSGS
jgi:glycerol-3-phosphate cytidylyltransferase-like family protein